MNWLSQMANDLAVRQHNLVALRSDLQAAVTKKLAAARTVDEVVAIVRVLMAPAVEKIASLAREHHIANIKNSIKDPEFFIRPGSSLSKLTPEELNEVLSIHNLPVGGKLLKDCTAVDLHAHRQNLVRSAVGSLNVAAFCDGIIKKLPNNTATVGQELSRDVVATLLIESKSTVTVT